MKKIFIFLIIILILGLGLFFWQGIYLPKDSTNTENKLFLVKSGEGVFEIGQNLEKEGLIKNKYFFSFYAIIKRLEKNFLAGRYELNSSMNIPKITDKIISGQIFKIKITIPEGFKLMQISQILREKNLISADLDTFYLKEFKSEFSFLNDAPDERNLEGFLFPDTYFFEGIESDKEIIEKFLVNFDKKLNPELSEEIKRQEKTIFDIVIMASLIEKEVKTREEKELVSGILWKRLENNMPLQVDATLAYITNKKTTKISIEETQIDSPYNTYKYLGLPLGPICNPGLESLKAAIYPKNSEYWYYLSTPEGKTIFSKTLAEHNIAKAKYLW